MLLRSREPLDAQSLALAFHAVVEHHEAFSLRYSQSADGSWTQRHASADAVADAGFWIRDAKSTDELTAICNEAHRSLDLENGPVLRGVFITMTDGSSRVLLVVHHLVIDGVSWRILLADLQQSYRRIREGEPLALPTRSSSYGAWGRRLTTYAGDHADEFDYWQGLAASTSRLAL